MPRPIKSMPAITHLVLVNADVVTVVTDLHNDMRGVVRSEMAEVTSNVVCWVISRCRDSSIRGSLWKPSVMTTTMYASSIDACKISR